MHVVIYCLQELMPSALTSKTDFRHDAQTPQKQLYDYSKAENTPESMPQYLFNWPDGCGQVDGRKIQELSALPSIVLGTGGGAVLREENQQTLKNTGWVIYLATSPERLHQRTRYDRNRPLLQTKNPLATLTELYEKRHPIYEDLADIVIKTGSGHVTRVVNEIITQLTLKLNQQAAALSAEAESKTSEHHDHANG